MLLDHTVQCPPGLRHEWSPRVCVPLQDAWSTAPRPLTGRTPQGISAWDRGHQTSMYPTFVQGNLPHQAPLSSLFLSYCFFSKSLALFSRRGFLLPKGGVFNYFWGHLATSCGRGFVKPWLLHCIQATEQKLNSAHLGLPVRSGFPGGRSRQCPLIPQASGFPCSCFRINLNWKVTFSPQPNIHFFI